MPEQIPVVNYLTLGAPPETEPHLVAHSCTTCGALYFDRRNACAKCFGVDFEPRALQTTGTLRAFTFVGRVKRPFASAIVDLDGGGVVKANLLGVDDPASITGRARVRMDTFVAGTDDDGTEAVAFGFRLDEVTA